MQHLNKKNAASSQVWAIHSEQNFDIILLFPVIFSRERRKTTLFSVQVINKD